MTLDGPRWWIESERDERALHNGYTFDERRAEHVWGFFPRFLVHFQGKWWGRPFDLLDWQAAMLGRLFGWVGPDGLRRYRRCYCEVPKKNGKSTLAAGVGLYLFGFDGEPGAQVYATATKLDQAGIVWGEASKAVQASPILRRRFKVRKGNPKHIADVTYQSTFGMLSQDGEGGHGFNAHGIIMDEMHAWRTRAARGFWESLRYAGAQREQPVAFIITTAGKAEPQAIGFELHEHAKAVRDGDVDDPTLLVAIFAAEGETDDKGEHKDDDPLDPETHAKANPSYGVLIKPDEMRREAELAATVPSDLLTFQQLRLNVWQGEIDRWIKLPDWDACALNPETGKRVNAIEWRREALERLAGRSCIGGLDIGSVDDLAAFVLVFPPLEDDEEGFDVVPWFWCPGDTVEARSRRTGVSYRAWIDSGFMVETPGNATDFGRLRSDINGFCDTYPALDVGIDRLFQGEQLAQNLVDDGLVMTGYGMGYASMALPCKHLERLVLKGAVRHGNNPILRWNAANAAADRDPAGNVKPNKTRSKDKIDGLVATLIAIGRALVREAPRRPTYYNEHDVELL